jgi:very-short-patch-repair endonuclease
MHDSDLPAVPATPALSPAEACARGGRHASLSHESACAALGIELLAPGSPCLTVPRSRSRVVVPGWQVIRADVAAADREHVNGLPCTAAARTVADLSRSRCLTEAVVAGDSALRNHLVCAPDLLQRLAQARGRRAGASRAVGRALDPLAGSVLETLLRLVLRDAGLRPVSQHVICDRDGSFVARVDFCWPEQRLVVEADGFAFHADRAAYRKDRERLNALERLGWRVLRFTWEDVRSRPLHVVALVEECLAGLAA